MAEGFTKEQINEMVHLLSTLPPAKPMPVNNDILKERCLCGELVDVSALESLNTGVFRTIGDVCKGCKAGHEADRKHARVVCARCKRVIMRLKPATDKTGFVFQAGKTYHLTECGLCNPDIKSANIIEKTLWDRSHCIKK